jgi:hypothetical protein
MAAVTPIGDTVCDEAFLRSMANAAVAGGVLLSRVCKEAYRGDTGDPDILKRYWLQGLRQGFRFNLTFDQVWQAAKEAVDKDLDNLESLHTPLQEIIQPTIEEIKTKCFRCRGLA